MDDFAVCNVANLSILVKYISDYFSWDLIKIKYLYFSWGYECYP